MTQPAYQNDVSTQKECDLKLPSIEESLRENLS